MTDSNPHLDSLKAKILDGAVRLQDSRVVNSWVTQRERCALGSSGPEAIDKYAARLGMPLKPCLRNGTQLYANRDADTTSNNRQKRPLYRNQAEIIRAMIETGYACTADLRQIKQARAEHHAFDSECKKIAQGNTTHSPCVMCRDDVFDFCANTGEECDTFLIWAAMKCGGLTSSQIKFHCAGINF